MRVAASKLRNLLSGRTTSAAASVTDNLVFPSLAMASYSTAVRADDRTRTAFMTTNGATLSATHFQSFGINHSRSFSYSSLREIMSDFPEVQIETDEQFNEHLRKIQDELLPAIFCFTDVAARCSIPDMLDLHLKYLDSYPKRVYRINIAEESLGFILSKLDIPQEHQSSLGYLYCYKHLRKDSSKVVLIETIEQYNESRRKVKREKLAAIYYFTSTVSFEPSRLICPIFEWLSEKYPHVTMYKIDMDMVKDKESLSLEFLKQAFPRPCMNLYSNGKRVRKLSGCDIKKKLQYTVAVYEKSKFRLVL